MKNLTENIIEIAKEAGHFIRDSRDFEISEKTDAANLVTTMDVKVQELILDRLQKLLPEASVLAEENEVHEVNDGYVWVVDPIDATTNYAYDCKYSCISIALLHDLEGIIGVVYNPYLDEVFMGEKGKGSFLNGKQLSVTKNPLAQSLIVVGTAPYKKSEATYTFDTMKKLFLSGRDIRRTGSAVLDLCYVASGRFDAFFESSLAPWDYSAAAVILKEAGGIIEAIAPDSWGYSQSIGIIAGNSYNFDDLKKLITR